MLLESVGFKPNAPGEDWKRDVAASDCGDEALETLLVPVRPVTEESGRAKSVDCGIPPAVLSGVEALLDEVGEGSLGEEGRFTEPMAGFWRVFAEVGAASDSLVLFAPAGKLKVKAVCFKRRFSFCSRPRRSRRFSLSLSRSATRASRAATWSSS